MRIVITIARNEMLPRCIPKRNRAAELGRHKADRARPEERLDLIHPRAADKLRRLHFQPVEIQRVAVRGPHSNGLPPLGVEAASKCSTVKQQELSFSLACFRRDKWARD